MKALGITLTVLAVIGGGAIIWAREWCHRNGWTIDA